MTTSGSWTIHPIVCGLNATDQGIMTYQRHYGTRIHIPIYAWFLEGPRKILIDTGLEDFVVDPEVEAALDVHTETLEEGLNRLGVKPQDIEIVIHTHLHDDHCQNDSLFPQAEVFVQRREWQFCLDPHPLDHRFDAELLEGVRLTELDGDAEIEPGLRVISTPGHTPGGQSVVIDTKESGKVLITGFCANEKNFPDAGPAICPGVHTDALQAWDSAQKVKAMKERGEVDVVVPLHALWPARKGVIR